MRIVNNRTYPLEIEHPGLQVAQKAPVDYGSLESLSHLISGPESILAPGAQVGYRIDVPVGQAAGARTTLDGLGQSLYALQTGITTLLAILTRFGAGSPDRAISILNDSFGYAGCTDAIAGHNPGAILAACMSPKDMIEDFSSVGLLLAPLAAASGLAQFFVSEFQGLHDIWTSKDQYAIIVRHQNATPVLGQLAGDFSHGEGFGAVRPVTVFNGGDPTGLVQHITWSSWGGATATGTGVRQFCR